MTLRPEWIMALTLTFGIAAPSSAQEPTKPTSPASATNPAVPAAGHSIHGEAFNDGPRRKATLIPGMGKVDFPVTTARPEAQAFVTQGVAQLHSFYYFEAERSFRQAALLDPDCPMAYWGMAMANVNNAKRAKGFLKEAKAKAGTTKLTRREQMYIDSLDALYKDGGSDRANKKEHLLGLEAIVAEFPDDLEARAWMAMVAWQTAGGRHQPPGRLDVTIESVLDKEPLHPGSHHYRIHLWDHVKVQRAEKAAALYAKSAPGIAHAWHMPGHTYTEFETSVTLDAAYQQEGSARVDHAYMIRDRVMPFEIHNYAHNNQWLATSLGHVGRALGRHHRGPQPRRAAPRPAEKRTQRRRLTPALGPAPLGRDPDSLRALGRPDRRHRIQRPRLDRPRPREGREGVYPRPGLCRQGRPGEARRPDRPPEDPCPHRSPSPRPRRLLLPARHPRRPRPS